MEITKSHGSALCYGRFDTYIAHRQSKICHNNYLKNSFGCCAKGIPLASNMVSTFVKVSDMLSGSIPLLLIGGLYSPPSIYIIYLLKLFDIFSF